MPLQAKQLFSSMADFGVQPSSNIYLSLITACAHHGLWDDAIGILGHMCR